MTFTLRPYQQEAINKGIAFLRATHGESGIEILPTAAGKSIVIAGIVQGLDAPCVVFQPSKEILEQNYAKLRAYGYHPSVYSASLGRKEIGEITLATIGSVTKKKQHFEHFKYALIDEAHLVSSRGGMYSDFISSLGIKVLGFTATPYRLSNTMMGSMLKFLTRTRPRIFSKVVYCVQNGQLFRDGYLCPLDYKIVEGFDRAKIKVNSTGADFDDRSVQKYLVASQFQERLLKVVNRLIEIGRTRILVFTRFVEEAKWLADRVPGFSIVTGKTGAREREGILRQFKAGRIIGVANVGVLTTGFDYPELDTVVLARPTMSLALYFQMTGRGVRIHPDKKSAMIVDMVGLVEQFGHVEDLEIRGPDPKWAVWNKGKQLTNVFSGGGFNPYAKSKYYGGGKA